MKKILISVTLITASLTFLALMRFVPAQLPQVAQTTQTVQPIQQINLATQPLQLQTVQVSSPKLLLHPSVPTHRQLKPKAELEIAPEPIAVEELSPLWPLNLALLPAAIVLPERELIRVSPLLLQKKNTLKKKT